MRHFEIWGLENNAAHLRAGSESHAGNLVTDEQFRARSLPRKPPVGE